ncbi:PKD domain-containing protein [Taibaiella koreensis]|uniref:PKD domain-containing protein n=1 Tax=Taibaiella koreensis TaxID=1268548 RepID=UPI000E5A0B84|nr:PKD domain-containing protein [Taibaiella koreensis]
MRKIILFTRHVLLLCLLTALGQTTWGQVITGPDTVCVGVPSVFTATPGGTAGYTWLANPAVTPTSTSSTATITFNSPTTTGNVTVLFPGFTPPPGYATKTVVVIPAPDLAITSNFEVGCQSIAMDSVRKGEQGGNNQNMEPDGPCIKVCENSIVRYYATGVTAGTFTWNVVGATLLNNWGDSIEVQWGAPGTAGSISLHAVTPCAAYDKEICVQVTAKPRALFAVLPDPGPAKDFKTCVKNLIQFQDLSQGTPQSPIVSWYWDFGDGNTSAQQSPTYSYDNPGSYIIRLTVKNACNCTDVYEIKVDVSPLKGPDIICPSVVCEKQKATYKTSVSCSNYQWQVTGGSIVNGGGPGDPFVEVVWAGSDFGYVSLTTPGCGATCPGTTTIKVPVVSTSAQIDGPLVICTGKEYEYTLPLWPGTRWNWGVINEPTAVQGIRTDYRVVVKFDNPGSYTIHGTYQNGVTLCGGDAQLKVVVVDPSVILGDDFACQNDNKNYTLNTGDFATWVLNGPAPQSGSGTNFNASFPLPGTYVLSAIGNFCSDPITIKVQKLPGIVNTMTGDDTVCLNVPYTYKATANDPNSVFTWQAIGGTVTPGNGDEVTVVWTSAGFKQLNVWREQIEEPHCAGPVKSMNIIQDPFNPTITGPATACGNGYNDYLTTYNTGDSYYWNVTPGSAGSIVGNVYGQTAKVLWKNVPSTTVATISLVVTKCGKTDTVYKTVTVNPSPLPILTSPVNACPGWVTISTTSGAANYTWDIPGVYSATTPMSSITVPFPYNNTSSPVVYTISVKASGAASTSITCPPQGTAATTINILPGPVAYASSPGPLALCPGTVTQLIGTYTNNAPTPLTFRWLNSGSPYTTPTTVSPDTATGIGGSFVFIATAANGCTDTSDAVVITTLSSCGSSGGPGGPSCTPPTNPATLSAVVNCNVVTLTPSAHVGATQSWSYSTLPTSGINTTTVSYTNPGIYTINYTETWGGTTCASRASVQVKIGAKADFYHKIACGPGTTYNVTFEDRTAYLTGFVIGPISWSISPAGSAAPATGTGNTFVSSLQAGVSYTVTESVGVTPPGGGTTTFCTVTRNILMPTKPTVSIVNTTIPLTANCSGLPISFGPNITPAPPSTVVASYLWNFGTGFGTSAVDSPSTAFSTNTPISQPISLTITDAYGCTASGSTGVNIFPHNLSGIVTGGDTVCSGAPVQLNYTNTGSSSAISPYLWNWDEHSTPTSVPTYGATASGAYWVQVFDIHSCRANTLTENVMIIKSPVATIRGDVDYCDGDAVELNGYLGAGTVYEWRRNGGAVISTAATISDAGLSPGTYTYQLKVTNTDPLSGVSCSSTTSTSITINPLPGPPSISGPVIIDCATNEMTLTASHGSPGTFTWSNGTNGAVNTIYQGGPYRVWYTNSVGCRSHKDIYVPYAPEKYFEYFPSGCYSMCKAQISDLYLYGPPGIAFQQWQWLRNGGVDMSGFNSTVSPYKVPTFGQYQEMLNNGMCAEKSDIMDIKDAQCMDCEGAIKEVRLRCDPSVPGRYFLDISISNNYGVPGTFSLGSDYGPILPSIGGVGPFGGVSLNIAFNSLSIPPPAVIKIQLLFMYGDGRKCYRSVDVKVPKCSWDPQRPAPEDEAADNGQRFTVLDAMELYPNPAGQQATVSYDYGAHTKGDRSIVVYDIAGRKVATHKVTESKGKWIMGTSEWISGMYLIRMEADGETLHVQRLSVTH